jgi:hypothetical protein
MRPAAWHDRPRRAVGAQVDTSNLNEEDVVRVF